MISHSAKKPEPESMYKIDQEKDFPGDGLVKVKQCKSKNEYRNAITGKMLPTCMKKREKDYSS